MTKRCVAQAHRLFQHASNTGVRLPGERVDHLQHLGGRGLLFQRLPLLGDQPRILHRDHGLGGKVLQQGDFACQRTGRTFRTIGGDEAKQRIVLA